MTRTHIKAAITLGALCALAIPCAAQTGGSPWSGNFAAAPASGNPFTGEQRYAPPAYAARPMAPVVPGAYPPANQPAARYGAPTPPAYTAPAPNYGTAYPYTGYALPGFGYGFSGMNHYPGTGYPGFGTGLPLYGGSLPGLGYAAPGGLHTPGLYGSPYPGSLAPLHNPYATGFPGLYGLGPYGM